MKHKKGHSVKNKQKPTATTKTENNPFRQMTEAFDAFEKAKNKKAWADVAFLKAKREYDDAEHEYKKIQTACRDAMKELP
jgi:hypothetical protein